MKIDPIDSRDGKQLPQITGFRHGVMNDAPHFIGLEMEREWRRLKSLFRHGVVGVNSSPHCIQ